MALNTVREGEIESLSNSSSSDTDSSGLIGFWIEGMSYNLDTTTLIDGSNFELSSDGKNIQNGSVSYQQNNVNSLGYLKIPVQPAKQYYIGIK